LVGDCFGVGSIHFAYRSAVAGEIVDERAGSRGKMVSVIRPVIYCTVRRFGGSCGIYRSGDANGYIIVDAWGSTLLRHNQI
jgi:hypothetical protein